MILLASFSGSALTDEDGDDIQWMPPGVHEIEPSTPDGEVKKITVLVDEAAAEAVEEARARYQAEFDAGHGDAPYTDFCHADQEASSWVLRVYWGGDDPKKGGIRAVVDWTDEGRAKKGKSLKRFSPGFYVSDEPDAEGRYHITGAPANMGGLVNRAAFRSIQHLSASATTEGGEKQHNNQDQNTMTEEEIKALRDENAALKKQLEDLQKTVAAMQEKDADAAVEAACAAGKIAPDLKASWKENILKNPAAKELLASLPVNPAFRQAYTAQDNKGDGAKTGKALLAQHAAITDPAERLAFFRKHEKELIAARG